MRVQRGPGIRAPPAWAAGPWGSCRPAPWWHLEGGSGEAGGLAGLEAGAAGRQRGCVCPHHCPLPPPMTSGLDSRPVLSRNRDRDLAPEGGTTSLAPGDVRAGGVLGRRSLKLGLRVVIIGHLSPDRRGRARAWQGGGVAGWGRGRVGAWCGVAGRGVAGRGVAGRGVVGRGIAGAGRGGAGALASGGASYSVPSWVPVTRAVRARGLSVDLRAHGPWRGAVSGLGACPSWGGAKDLQGVGSQGTEDRPLWTHPPLSSQAPILVPAGGDPLLWWASGHALP